MTTVFVDTGAFVARYIERDPFHRDAQSAWRQLAARRGGLATSSFVLDETFTLLARRASYAFAAERARVLLHSSRLAILRPDAQDELHALQWFEKFADHEISFTDAVSFALMKRHRIRRAFTFDCDFADAGFEIWPE